MELVNKAHAFAAKAHAGAVRNWTGEPYIEHCERVAMRLAALGAPAEVVAAGFLHDVIEDTGIGPAEIVTEFGPEVAALVLEVTDPVMVKLPGNKPLRLAAVVEHLSLSSPDGASIKLADMLDNSSNVEENDAVFAKSYLAGMRLKLAVLGHGHPELFAELSARLA